jgi:hypothetical protein
LGHFCPSRLPADERLLTGRKPTFAEAMVNGEDAPIPDLPALAAENKGKSDLFRPGQVTGHIHKS